MNEQLTAAIEAGDLSPLLAEVDESATLEGMLNGVPTRGGYHRIGARLFATMTSGEEMSLSTMVAESPEAASLCLQESARGAYAAWLMAALTITSGGMTEEPVMSHTGTTWTPAGEDVIDPQATTATQHIYAV